MLRSSPMTRRSRLLCGLSWLTLAATGCAQEDQAAHDARMRWWREARFGLFVHWGLYAIPAGEGKDGSHEHGEWIRTTARIPLAEYEGLRERWNPTRFDARQWARIAK